MKSLLFLCSLVLLCLAPKQTNSQSTNSSYEISAYNPYFKLAEVKNSMNMSIDDYVNNIIERVKADPSSVIAKAKEQDSWLYKSFLRDSKYMARMNEIHVEIRNEFDSTALESEAFFEELRANFPYYAELLPVLSSPRGQASVD